MARDNPYIITRRRRKERRRDVPTGSAGFTIRAQGSLSLVLPEGKRGRWAESERIFRSLIYDRDHRVVSCGLPKFFLQQDDTVYKSEAQELIDAQEPLTASIKYDGSLIIRSVIRGRVVFRTRSSFDGDHHTQLVRELATQRYPVLLDPDFAADESLHFEFVSPRQRVIISYPDPDLILIGRISHRTLELSDWEELTLFADEHDLRLADTWSISESIDQLQAEVDAQTDIEGLVLRWGQKLLKVKNTRYELAQEQRYELHPRKIYQICKRKAPADSQRLLKLLKLPASSPLIPYVNDQYQLYRQTQEDIDERLSALRKMVAENNGLARKQFNKRAHQLGIPDSLAAIALHQGHADKAEELLERQLVKDRFVDPTSNGI